MKFSTRTVVVATVVIVMAVFVAIGVMQTQKQAATPAPVVYDPMTPTNQHPADLSQQSIIVAVDTEYESAIEPVAVGNLPQQIVGVPLTETLVGQDALKAINMIHGTNIKVLDGLVARYRLGQQSIDLWFTTSASVDEATELLTLMLEKMQNHSVYSTPIPMPIRKRIYYQTVSANDINFFFQRGRQVVWVTLNIADEQMMPAMQAVVGI
ncbi:MAG: hypothetical protein GX058_09590 [Firmicutes bacterium]|nr:hypothetical protein [Bacillota bacterium]